MNTYEPINPVARLWEIMPTIVVDAATYCSVTHWFDQKLGLAIIEKFLGLNSNSDEVFYELIQLPFVYPREDKVWQYTSAARMFLKDQLLKRGGQFAQVSIFLAQYFRADRDTCLIQRLAHHFGIRGPRPSSGHAVGRLSQARQDRLPWV